MYHTIEFNVTGMIDLEVSARQPLERLCVERGTRLRVQLRPYIIEAADGPADVADLMLMLSGSHSFHSLTGEPIPQPSN